MSTLREQSRNPFNDENVTHDNVRTGSLQRIADACEIMAKDRQDLINQLDYYKTLAKDRAERMDQKNKEISTLKGLVTRYKNQVNKLK
jgi:hypothetical protein